MDKDIENNSYNSENSQLNKSEEQIKDIDLQEIYNFVCDPYVSRKMMSSGCYLTHIPPNLLNDPLQISSLDSYYGVLSFYEWHKTPIPTGAEFTSVFHKLEAIKTKFPTEKKLLDIICRKTAYLNILNMEIEYISNRYKWSEKSYFEEVYLAKFENFTTSLIELIVTCINLHEKLKENPTKYNIENFQDIVKFLVNSSNELPNYYHLGINHSINLSAYIFIRNNLVHNFDQVDYVENEQNPLLKINNIPYKNRLGKYNEYVGREFNTNYKGKKTPQSFKEYTDSKFPYIKFKFFLNKNSKIDLETTEIGFEMDIISLTKKMLGNLFDIQKNLFQNIMAQ
jgi:hypothetical protein